MNFLAAYYFKTAYKTGAGNFTADFSSRYSNRKEAPDESEKDGDILLTSGGGTRRPGIFPDRFLEEIERYIAK